MASEEKAEKAETSEEKPRRAVVPPMALGEDGKATALGIAEHADAVRKAQWDENRRAFRDPNTCMLALFTYCRLTANRLSNTEREISQLKQQVAALESFNMEAMKQAQEMFAQLETAPAEIKDLMGKLAPDLKLLPASPMTCAPETPVAPEPASEKTTAPVKAEKKGDKATPRKNGAA